MSHAARTGIAAAGLLILLLAGVASGEWVYQREAGWVDLNAPPPRAAEGRYERALALMTDGRYRTAQDLFQSLATQSPDPRTRARAGLRVAECQIHLGRADQAFRECAILRYESPAGLTRKEIERVQWEAARALAPQGNERAAVFLREVAVTVPRFAADARWLLGALYFDDGLYGLAVREYQRIVRDHPGTSHATDALFRAGLCDLRWSRTNTHDPARLARALGYFRRFLKAAPKSGSAEEARVYIWAVENLRAEPDPERRRVYYAVTLLPENKPGQAYGTLKKCAKKFADSFAGEAARFYQAEALRHMDKSWKAFKVYEKLVEDYPHTGFMRDVVNREFEIARCLARDGKNRKAAVVFEKIADHNPSGPLADDAEMCGGNAAFERGAYDEARVAYESILENYRRSEWAPEARYRLGLCDLRQAELLDCHFEFLRKARMRFEEYLNDCPEGPLAPDARKARGRCLELEARHHFAAAQLYRRQRRPAAALAYLRLVRRDYPGTVWAANAARLIGLFREKGYEPPFAQARAEAGKESPR